ncbi:MAG: peptidase S10, partial [Anaerolineae bacterium]|nr:peptidase S10 [Anaerolineae bacterium]
MPDKPDKQEESKPAPSPEAEEKIATTEHTITIGGEEIRYTATAGTMVLKEEAEKEGKAEGEKPRATLFYIAYARQGVSDPATRPLTFSFNGGPGSSSVWLHMGL